MHSFGEVLESPRPVMTFRVKTEWLAIPVEKVERVALAEKLLQMPCVRAEHLGLLLENGALIPVLELGSKATTVVPKEGWLVAILHVRGESVGLRIDAAGRILHGWRATLRTGAPPAWLGDAAATTIVDTHEFCWLVDPDALWRGFETP